MTLISKVEKEISYNLTTKHYPIYTGQRFEAKFYSHTAVSQNLMEFLIINSYLSQKNETKDGQKVKQNCDSNQESSKSISVCTEGAEPFNPTSAQSKTITLKKLETL